MTEWLSAGGLLNLGFGFDLFFRFCLWFFLLQTNLVLTYKCAEFGIVILLAV